jgi:hypothetical protein
MANSQSGGRFKPLVTIASILAILAGLYGLIDRANRGINANIESLKEDITMLRDANTREHDNITIEMQRLQDDNKDLSNKTSVLETKVEGNEGRNVQAHKEAREERHELETDIHRILKGDG